MMRPILLVSFPASDCAIGLGLYWDFDMIPRTSSLVFAETPGLLLITSDTDDLETPASRAISDMVILTTLPPV